MSPFKVYWQAYGGWSALFASEYFAWAVAIWFAALPLWLRQGELGNYEWVSLSFQVLPGLVSFSLAALAVLLAFSNEVVLKLMRSGGASNSYLMKVSAALIHFIVVEFTALILAVFLIAYPHWVLSGAAFLAFIYSIMCGLAAAMAIFGVARIMNHAGILDEDE